MSKILQAIATLTFLVQTFVTLAEVPGNGPEKLAEVLKNLKSAIALLEGVIELPDLVKTLLANDTILTLLVNLTVWAFNIAGIFPKETPA